MNTIQKDEQLIGRDFPVIPVEVEKTKNFSVVGKDGREYIDFLMGWCVGNIGWNVKELKDAIRNYDGPTYVMPFYTFKPWIELAENITSLLPGNLEVVYRTTGGTESIEVAMQAAMTQTKRSKFLSIGGTGAYHGHSIGAMSIGDKYFRTRYKNLLPDCHKIEPPFNKKTALEAVKLIENGDIAAYISEPIVINMGAAIPETEYYDIIFQACKKYGTLFVVDEVATGFGRTGKMFGFEHYNVDPDIVCLGKGLSGGYGAIGATVMKKEIAESMKFYMSFYSTFGWHPLNAVAALANITYIKNHKQEILENVDRQSKYFENRLHEMQIPKLKEIRIRGLVIVLEFSDSEYVGKLVQKCFDNGLLVLDLNKTQITIFPALTIDDKTAKKGLDILEKSLQRR